MELLGGDAHLTAKAELSAVGEAGGAVDVDGGTVHCRREEGSVGVSPGQDGFAVAGGVSRDVGDGFLHAVHDFHRKDVVEELRVEILRPGGGAGDEGGSALVQPQFHRVQTLGGAVGAEALGQLRQELSGDGAVDEADFLGVADAGAAGLGVLDDVQRLGLVGGVVHEDVADAGAGLDAGDFRVLDTGTDESGPAARDEQVHIADGGHQGVGRGMGGVLNEADCCFGQTVCPQTLPQGLNDGVGRAPRLFAAAEDAGIAALDGEGGSVAGDVGAALVDDGDDAHRHGGLLDDEAIGTLDVAQHPTHRVRQGGNVPDALGHGLDALGRQGKAVQHDVADVPLSGGHVLGVGGEDGVHGLRCAEGISHPEKGRITGAAVRKGNGSLGPAGGFQNFLCGHVMPPVCGPQSGCLRHGPRRCHRAARGGRRLR